MAYRESGSSPSTPVATDEFETYIARRRRNRILFLVAGVLVMVALATVPYFLMMHDVITDTVYGVCVTIDVLLFLGIVRAFFTYLRDRIGPVL